MSENKLYKNCLHCDEPLVQTPTGRRKIYCNRQHADAFRREALLNMARLDNEPEVEVDKVLRLIEDGPVLQPLPEIAVWDVRDGIPMRVV